MYDKTTVKDWAAPAFFSGLCWIGLVYVYRTFGAHLWMALVILAGVVLLAMAISHFLEYVNDQASMALRDRMSNLAITADAEIFRAARDLAAQSPEMAGEMAKRFGRPDLILLPHRQGKHAQILVAGSDVTLKFALDALMKSTDKSYAAQRIYSDGTYHYDSNRVNTDRAQWMTFNWILARDGICTRYVPGQVTNEAPSWLPPWNPDRVRDNWLIPADLLETIRPYLAVEEEVTSNEEEGKGKGHGNDESDGG